MIEKLKNCFFIYFSVFLTPFIAIYCHQQLQTDNLIYGEYFKTTLHKKVEML